MNPCRSHHTDSDSDQGINQFFDFTKFPNLQETSLGIRWSSGSLLWFSTSLSTLEPSTSPRLSAIRVSISGRYPGPSTLARMREELGNDLRLIEDQAARIEREFMGVASFTYYRQPLFSVSSPGFSLRLFLTGLSALTSILCATCWTGFSFIPFEVGTTHLHCFVRLICSSGCGSRIFQHFPIPPTEDHRYAE